MAFSVRRDLEDPPCQRLLGETEGFLSGAGGRRQTSSTACSRIIDGHHRLEADLPDFSKNPRKSRREPRVSAIGPRLGTSCGNICRSFTCPTTSKAWYETSSTSRFKAEAQKVYDRHIAGLKQTSFGGNTARRSRPTSSRSSDYKEGRKTDPRTLIPNAAPLG